MMNGAYNVKLNIKEFSKEGPEAKHEQPNDCTFLRSCYCRISLKICRHVSVPLKQGQNNGPCTWRPACFFHVRLWRCVCDGMRTVFHKRCKIKKKMKPRKIIHISCRMKLVRRSWGFRNKNTERNSFYVTTREAFNSLLKSVLPTSNSLNKDIKAVTTQRTRQKPYCTLKCHNL